MAKKILYRFFQGNTSIKEEETLRKWIESDPENQAEYEKERRLYDMLLLLSDEESLTTGVKIPFYRKEWLSNISKVAAIIIGMVGSAFLYGSYKTDRLYADSMQTLVVPPGQQINLHLSDGTSVYLNSNSKISYPAVFSKKERLITLEGEAYFEVSHNPTTPFVVETKKGKIEVIGTKFNVEAYPEEDFFETSLMEGAVKVKQGKYAYLLKPDQKITFREGKMSISPIQDYNAYRWREGLICFQDESFVSIINQFERSYGIKMKIENKKLYDCRYSGKFRHGDGVMYALRVLRHDVDFEFERDEENQIIYIR